MADGRVIIAPISNFPEIKKLKPSQRKKFHIMAGIGFDFDDSDEVYHISEFLGADNSADSLSQKMNSGFASKSAEPKVKYRTRKN